MALLNRQLRWKAADEIPLAEEEDRLIVDIRPNDDDEDNERNETFKHRGISLWVYDAATLVIEHFQYYALLLALAQRWGWPLEWIKATYFVFLFNFDAWEFWNVQSGAYNRSKTAFVDTKLLGFNYPSYIASWGVLVFITGSAFIACYLIWQYKRPLYLLLYVARLKRILFLVIQFLALPFAIAIARVFHCRKNQQDSLVMDVHNDIQCNSGIHLGFMALTVAAYILLFIVYPIIIALSIREQVFCNSHRKHEGYLQLKEAEYEQGLDILWYVGQFHLFSSYKRFWVYYNPLKLIFKLLLIIAYAISMSYMFYGSSLISLLFLLAFLSVLCKKPFRVKVFNYMLAFSHLYIAANALIGNFMVLPPWDTASEFVIVSFLRYPTIIHILISLNGGWLTVFFLWAIYLILREKKIIGRSTLWPKLSYENSNDVGEDTKKYLKAVLRGRHTLEQALSTIPLFSPVHELSRQIQIINAFCREAEYISDPTHDTLWDLLDELIQAHNHLSPISVFGTASTSKESVRETAKEFLQLMPCFSKRLAQREYDLSLVPPRKRRLLLKMYALSVFVNGTESKRKQKEEAGRRVKDALKRHDNYYEHPPSYASSETHTFFTSRPTTAATLDDYGRLQSAGSVAGFLEQLENWTSQHPCSEASNSSGSGKGSRPATASSFKSNREESMSSMSLPGQAFTEDEFKPSGKLLQADSETLTTRTSGYTSGNVQDSDADSFHHSPRHVLEDTESNNRSSSP